MQILRTSRFLAIALALALTAACTSDSECDRCDSDDDCNPGFICSTFRDENGNQLAQKRCASGSGSTTCRPLRR